MTNYIIQRLVWVFIILFTTLTITFVLLKLAPEFPPSKNDERDIWLTRQYNDGYYTLEIYYLNNPQDVRKVEDEIALEEGINKTIFIVNPVSDSTIYKVFRRVPIFDQYITWLTNVLTDFNWGTSSKVRVNAPAFSLISDRFPLTFRLNFFTLLFYIPFGFLFGILAALNKDTWIDNLMQVLIMVFISLPALVFVLLLQIVFGYQLEILPALFPIIELESAARVASGYIIPVVAAGLPAIAGLTRLLRAELSEVLTSEFLQLAKTKGLSYKQAVVRHAIRNSMVPMLPIIIGSFAGLLSGSFILEQVYSIPGVGRITLQALSAGNYDYNVLMVSSAFYGIIGLIAVLIVDLSYGIIDPRIRMGAKK
jgi:oligopeptide transport system permease protein